MQLLHSIKMLPFQRVVKKGRELIKKLMRKGILIIFWYTKKRNSDYGFKGKRSTLTVLKGGRNRAQLLYKSCYTGAKFF